MIGMFIAKNMWSILQLDKRRKADIKKYHSIIHANDQQLDLVEITIQRLKEMEALHIITAARRIIQNDTEEIGQLAVDYVKFIQDKK